MSTGLEIEMLCTCIFIFIFANYYNFKKCRLKWAEYQNTLVDLPIIWDFSCSVSKARGERSLTFDLFPGQIMGIPLLLSIFRFILFNIYKISE